MAPRHSPRPTESRRLSASQALQRQNQAVAPRRLTDAAIEKAVQALERLEAKRREKRAQFSAAALSDDDDDDRDSPSPIMDRYIEAKGPQSVHTTTNFYPAQFDKLWRELQPFISSHWNVGSGRKSDVTERDMLFMSLAALKHCGTWDLVGSLFGQSGSTFATRVFGFLKVLRPCLVDKFVTKIRDKHSMHYMTRTGKVFRHYPEARYAVDVTFQQAEAPNVAFGEKKSFFSKKHGLYGHKVEVSVVPAGFAIGFTGYRPGSVNDKTIFEENEDFHQSQLVKQPDERNLPDYAPMKDQYPNQWALLADKGYQDIDKFVRGITPTKNPPGGHITIEEMSCNEEIASDRIIVENYFGRLKTLWSVAGGCYKWARVNYDVYFQCCVALTNVHVGFNPLRQDNDEYAEEYRRTVRRLVHIGNQKSARRAESQRKYKAKRAEQIAMRLSLRLAEDHFDEESGPSGLMDDLMDD